MSTRRSYKWYGFVSKQSWFFTFQLFQIYTIKYVALSDAKALLHCPCLDTRTLMHLLPFPQYDIFMCKMYSADHFNSLVLTCGMQGALIYQKMFKKDSKGVVQMNYWKVKKKVCLKSKKSCNRNGYDQTVETAMSDEDEHSTNLTFHFTGAYHMALKVGIGFFAFSSAISVLLVTLLPLWFALFCICVPFAIITEVIGVLTIAILQSFHPFYQKQMKQSRERDERPLRSSIIS